MIEVKTKQDEVSIVCEDNFQEIFVTLHSGQQVTIAISTDGPGKILVRATPAVGERVSVSTTKPIVRRGGTDRQKAVRLAHEQSKNNRSGTAYAIETYTGAWVIADQKPNFQPASARTRSQTVIACHDGQEILA